MKESEFIMIPKKVEEVKCNNHKTIKVMNQAAKIVLKAIDEKLEGKVIKY